MRAATGSWTWSATYRRDLYFFHNTVVSSRTTRTTLLRLSTNAQTAYVTDNAVVVTGNGNTLSLTDEAGTLRHGGNWYKPGYVSSFGTVTGAVVDTGGTVTGTDPGFVSLAGQDFHLTNDSPLRDKAVAPPAETSGHPMDWQYVKHTSGERRARVSPAHIGAYGDGAQPGAELPDGGTADAGTGTGSDAGTTPGLPPEPDEGDDGGCAATGAGFAGPLALLLLSALGARRRSRAG